MLTGGDARPALLLGTLEKEDPTGVGRIVRDRDGNFVGLVEHKDATPEQRQVREVNMSTYLFQTSDLLDSLDRLSNDNAQQEYYLTDSSNEKTHQNHHGVHWNLQSVGRRTHGLLHP